MANITGTLDKSITPTGAAQGLGEGSYLITVSGGSEDSPGAANAFQEIEGTLDKPIVLTLDGQGQGAITGTLDKSIVLTLDGEAKLLNGQLDKPIILTLDGAGSGNNSGLLDKPITLTLDSAVSVRTLINADLDKAIPLTLDGAGNPWSSRLDAPITLTLDGAGTISYGRVDATLPLTLDGAGGVLVALSGAMTLPAPWTIEAQIDPGITVALTLPALTISASISTSNDATVNATLPMLTLESNDGFTVNQTLPSLEISASLLTGRVCRVDTLLPALTSAAQMDGDYSGSASLIFPLLTSHATIFSGSGASVLAVIPSLTILSELAPGKLFDAALTLPLLTGEASAFQELFMDAALTLPALTSAALIDNVDTLIVSTFSVNTENLEVTQYSNYDFLALAMFNGNPVGINATGIYELSGSDDAGTDIDASALFGFDDFGTANMKRMFNAYLGYKSDGAIEIQISIDGEPAVRTYAVGKVSGTTGIKRGRATIAKGLRSRYWQVGVKNVAGSDLELDTLDLYTHETKRKVQ